MSNIIQHKRNATPGAIPTTGNLSYGELAINYTDGKLYTKNNSNNIINLPVSSISGANITPGLITTNSGVIISTAGGIARLYASLGDEIDNSDIYFDTDSDTDLHVAYKESTTYVGTTAISLSRSSAAQTLTGISIDGNAGSVTNGVYTINNQTISGVKTFTSQIVNTSANNTNAGAGQIYLNGATGNRIDFNTNGVGVPNLFSRTLGSKINLYPSLSTGSATDFAIGLANDGAGAPTRFWQSVNTTNSRFEWFAGSTTIGTLTGSGVLTIQGGTSQINVDNLRLDGSTISRTNTGNVTISPSLYSDNGYFSSIYAGGSQAGYNYGQLYVYDDVDSSIFQVTSEGVSTSLGIQSNSTIIFSPTGPGQGSGSLTINGQMTFERVSNSGLKIWMKGTDGIVRSTTLTLS